MAITRAQQVRQMLKDGKVAMQGGVKNYLGKKKTVTVPKDWQSSPDHPTTKLAYITKAEKDLLLKKDLHNSLNGKPNRGPSGVMSLNGWGDSDRGTSDASHGGGNVSGGGDNRDYGGGRAAEERSRRANEETQRRKKEAVEKSRKEALERKQKIELEEAKKAKAKKDREEMLRKAKEVQKKRDLEAKKAKEERERIKAKEEEDAARQKELDKLAEEKRVREKEEEDRQQQVFDTAFDKIQTQKETVMDRRKRIGAKEIPNYYKGEYKFDENYDEEKNDYLSGAIDSQFSNYFDPSYPPGISGGVLKALETPFKAGAKYTRDFFTGKVLGKGGFKNITPEDFSKMNLTQRNDVYDKYMSDRQAGYTDAYGNMTGGYRRETIPHRNADGTMTTRDVVMGGDGGGDNYVPPIVEAVKKKETEEEEVNPRDYSGLGARFMGSQFDFSGLADGGIARAGYMDGGMPEYQGGIMDLETGRQQYFLGKLVKKATRAVKKIAKSPLGKAAILGGMAYFGGGGGLPGFLGGKGMGGFSAKTLFSKKNPLLFTKGKFSAAKGLGLTTLAPFLFPGEEEKDGPMNLGPDFGGLEGVQAMRLKRDLANRFRGTQFAADGGRIGYAEGSKEPVAKETMPLLDMDNQEMDLRQEGGFVPIGRMERADDVPARLSKNEFVFTADAVRNAGEGDIDKGAEVMYNMMKNLESGGEVSEESQGLDGARKMFQTSQRLEEVL